LKEFRQTKISGRELLHICRKYKRMDELSQPIEVLTELGWIREISVDYKGSGRKPSQNFAVNPRLFPP
jgi:hypothetical protein